MAIFFSFCTFIEDFLDITMHLTRIDILLTLVREVKQYVWTKEYHYVGGDLLRDDEEEEEENPVFDTN